MFLLFETADLATIEGMFVSMPESLGVLVFGLGLTAAAVVTRRLLKRNETHNAEENAGKRA